MKHNKVSLVASDGFELHATLWKGAHGEGPMILMAGATGVPQRFYGKLAQFLAERGCSVLTLDYRGIGLSKPTSLRGFEASFLDWAKLDLDAGLRWCLERSPTAVVGHSFGGHAFGMLPDANQTLGLYTFGTGAGWHGHMPRSEQVKVLLMWNVIGPLATWLYGYLPSKRIGIGEDLPLGVYQQWKRWCRHPRYFFDDPAFEHVDSFRGLRAPIVAVNATDDLWAPPQSRDAFFSGYEGAQVRLETIEVVPGQPGIGHMGYIRPHCVQHWEQLDEWVHHRHRGA